MFQAQVVRSSSSRYQESGAGPPLPQSPKKKRSVQREDSIAAKLSKIKSSFFGQSQGTSELQPKSKQGQTHEVLTPPEELSEPWEYFRHSSQPWAGYRAPTPLPPIGSVEYYEVIKSSNPSPTTSNESELGSTPEHLSSSEIVPGPPPDLPESPYQTIIPRTGGGGPSRYFIPIKPRHVVISSGEEAVSRGLRRSRMNRSDPLLSSTTSSSSQPQPPPHQIVNIELSHISMSQVEDQARIVSPPLLRQSAIADHNSSSSKEETSRP